MSVDACKSRIYYEGAYPSDNWALQPYTLNDPKVVALASYKDCEYAIYMNPTDKRGYRSIARFIKNEEMRSTINRDYTRVEQRGLSFAIELTEEVYRQKVPIVQTFKAGNNSHRFEKESGITYVGKPEEPSFLHTHIIGRGNPEAEYIDGIKLDGPVPGLNFDMMAKTANEPGNNAKVKWKNGEMEKAVSYFKIEIEKLKEKYKEDGLTVKT